MNKKAQIILILLVSICLPILAYAETIILKSGKSVEGKLIEKTDKYIKIDFEGVPLTYFFDEIKSVDGIATNLPKYHISDLDGKFIYNISLNNRNITIYLGSDLENRTKNLGINNPMGTTILGGNEIWIDERGIKKEIKVMKSAYLNLPADAPKWVRVIRDEINKISDKEMACSRSKEILFHELVHLTQDSLLNSGISPNRIIERFPQPLLSSGGINNAYIINETGAFLGELSSAEHPKLNINTMLNTSGERNEIYIPAALAVREFIFQELGIHSVGVSLSEMQPGYHDLEWMVNLSDDQIRSAATKAYVRIFGIPLPDAATANIATNIVNKLNFDSEGNLVY